MVNFNKKDDLGYRGLPKVVFLAEAEAEAEGRKNFGLRPKTEAEAEGSTLGSFN